MSSTERERYRRLNSFTEFYVLIWNSDLSTADCLELEATAYRITRKQPAFKSNG